MESTLVYVLFGAFFLLLFLGAPIAISLGVAALATYLALGENPLAFVQMSFTSVGAFPLMALPAFILAGALMEAAGISKRLVDIAEAFAGPMTGGLGAATIFCLHVFRCYFRLRPCDNRGGGHADDSGDGESWL
ncbi:MAG: TRAP transporter permease [Marinobacter sp.]|nr:TRAP transporter permease [Marinobacter sp.]